MDAPVTGAAPELIMSCEYAAAATSRRPRPQSARMASVPLSGELDVPGGARAPATHRLARVVDGDDHPEAGRELRAQRGACRRRVGQADPRRLIMDGHHVLTSDERLGRTATGLAVGEGLHHGDRKSV